MDTKEELHNKFHELYRHIISSEDEEKMMTLGSVTKAQMEWFIENRPEQAEEYIEMLCSVKWDNYLTPKEAETIVAQMKPAAKWSKEQVRKALDSLGIEMEEAPYYNSCAMWATISMIYSDSGKTLAELVFKKPLAEVGDVELLTLIHRLAIDKLKDRDGMFNIRKYFNL